MTAHRSWTARNGALCEAHIFHTWDILCTGFSQKNVLNLHNRATGARIIDQTCLIRTYNGDSDSQLTLDSSSGFTFTTQNISTFFTKGAHPLGLVELESKDASPKPVESGTVFSIPSSGFSAFAEVV